MGWEKQARAATWLLDLRLEESANIDLENNTTPCKGLQIREINVLAKKGKVNCFYCLPERR